MIFEYTKPIRRTREICINPKKVHKFVDIVSDFRYLLIVIVSMFPDAKLGNMVYDSK